MLITIYDSTGTPKAQLSPNDSSTLVKEIQGDSILALSFTHYDYIALDVDDYIDFEGERFWLTEKYRPRQNAAQEWVYDIKLYGVDNLLSRLLVIKTVDGEDNPIFTLTAPPLEHVTMIVKCMNDGLGNISDWEIGQVEGVENIVIDYFGKYCDEALKEIAEKVGAEVWIEGHNVNICKCEHGKPISMGYNNGLLSIDPSTADNVKFYTRLYPVGSNRNINREKYGFSRLQLPGGQRYVEVNADKYSRADHYEKDAFADIYPRRIGTVSEVRREVKTGEDGNEFTIYYFKDSGLNFDPNDYEIGGLVKRVSFQEGSELAGLGYEENGTYYFEVNYNSSAQEFEIITIWPYGDEMQLPGDKLIPKAGDRYILWNISMPDEYYALAEAELLEAVEKYNEEHNLDIAVYKAPTDHVWIEENQIELTIGQRIRLESDNYFPEVGYRDSRITKIIRRVNLPSSMDLEIGDALGQTTQGKLNNSISHIRDYAQKAVTNTSSFTGLFRMLPSMEDGFDGVKAVCPTRPFTELKIGTPDGKEAITLSYDKLVRMLKLSSGVYSVGEITAFGNGGAGGSGGSGGGSVDLLTDWANYSTLIRDSYGLSAGLGYDLRQAVTALDQKFANYYTSVQCDARYQPVGNYLTEITKAQVEAVLTGNITSHTHQYIVSSGALTAASGTTVGSNGLRLYEVYNNGYPTTYGNLLRIVGGAHSGHSELLCGWGADTSVGPLMYRSKRDVAATEWSDWVTLVTSANYAEHVTSLPDRTNGTSTYLNYGAAGISTTSWLAAWNGYELRAISPANVLTTINALSREGGTMANTSLVTNLNADLLDGYHITNYQTGGWYSLTTYVYDATNGKRYYWHKIASIATGAGSGHAVLEILAQDDANYPSIHNLKLALSCYDNGTSKSVALSGMPRLNGDVEVMMTTGGDVWIRFSDIDWDCYAKFRLITGSMSGNGITIYPTPVKQEATPTGSTVISNGGGIKLSGTAFAYSPTSITANASSATKLNDYTAFKAWGQTFFENGVPKNVDGTMAINNPNYHAITLKRNLNGAYGGAIAVTLGNGTFVGDFGFDGGGFFNVRNASGTSLLSALQNGNVGIGTTAPAMKLHVAGATKVDNSLTVGGYIIGALGYGIKLGDGIITYEPAYGAFKFNKPICSEGEITAFGSSPTAAAGEGGGGGSYIQKSTMFTGKSANTEEQLKQVATNGWYSSNGIAMALPDDSAITFWVYAANSNNQLVVNGGEEFIDLYKAFTFLLISNYNGKIEYTYLPG